MDFHTSFVPAQLRTYQPGVMAYEYRGVRCLKSPIDLGIYLRLLWDARPATLFEIGTKAGGSALLFRDILRAYGLNTGIFSIDLTPPDLAIEGVTFLQGDATKPGETFDRHALFGLPRPWLVIDDAAHSYVACSALLAFFAEHLRSGEFLVIEDGVLDELGLSEQFGGGPNRAIGEFLAKQPETFEPDRRYCDMFGPNFTYNPNGYLRRR
jgi:cephalosporin hydroxylase